MNGSHYTFPPAACSGFGHSWHIRTDGSDDGWMVRVSAQGGSHTSQTRAEKQNVLITVPKIRSPWYYCVVALSVYFLGPTVTQLKISFMRWFPEGPELRRCDFAYTGCQNAKKYTVSFSIRHCGSVIFLATAIRSYIVLWEQTRTVFIPSELFRGMPGDMQNRIFHPQRVMSGWKIFI